MKRYRVFSIFSATVLMATSAYAQLTTASGQPQLTTAVQAVQTPQRGQRSGGLGPGQLGAPGAQNIAGYVDTLVAAAAPAAWWTDTALMTRLGLSDVQKARIENIFQTHRQDLMTSKDALEREEVQLSKLLAADTIDRPSVLTQINKVIQARSDMERANATMTLEMREQLTPAQWTQLQIQPTGLAAGRGREARRAVSVSPASAIYALDRGITLEGRVAAFNLAEPRSSIVIEVVGTDGKTTRWTGEMAGLAQLTQQGWTRSSLSLGEKVAIEGAPSLDASANAVFVRTVRKIPEQR